MNGRLAAGAILTGLGLLGYAAGVTVAYPGRAFSVTAVIVGVTLIGIHGSPEGDAE